MTLQVESGAPLPIPVSPPTELITLPLLNRLNVDRADATRPDDLLVVHSYPVLADGPHRELGLERDTQLSHDDDVEGCAQSRAHLGGDGDAPAGQSEDDSPASSEAGGPHHQGQVATSVHTIAEHRHHLLDTCSLPPSPRRHQIPPSRRLCLW